MKLKKRYTFLYMPDDHGVSRQLRVPWWLLAGGAALMLVFVVIAGFYGFGVSAGNGWLPGGSRFQRENSALRVTIDGLQTQVQDLRDEIDEIFAVQNLIAGAVNLPVMDEETFAAGVGGRGALIRTDVEVAVPIGDRGLGDELQLMLRQARIQRQGYVAMLDTLAVRENVRAHIPSIRPTDIGWVSSRFGIRKDPFTGKQTFHRGLDFSVPLGTEVRVTGDGVVVAVQQQRGFGRVIKVDHGGGVMTLYAHLDQTLVAKGDEIRRGDVIARSGNSGRSSAPHLHYEIRLGNRPVNPLSYILDSYAARK